jgi:metal-responsive CopG/Arc/MetJ family transcriptional regulator
MGKARVTITIDEDLLERIKDLAEQFGSKHSTLIESLLREAIAERELFSPKYHHRFLAAMHSPRPIETLMESLKEAGMDQKQIDTLRTRIHLIPVRQDLTGSRRKGSK